MPKAPYFKYLSATMIVLSMVAGDIALAEVPDNVPELKDTTEVRTTTEVKDSNEVQVKTETNDATEVENTTETADTNEEAGASVSDQHASETSKFVQSLTGIAGKDQNIGEEIRAVAKQEKDKSEEEDQAITAVETRSAIKTFLIGSDYKNLGVIRSGLATTQNSIDRLTRAMDLATDAQVKADLKVQIDALKASQLKLQAFVLTNESKFSLFGWFVRLFSK